MRELTLSFSTSYSGCLLYKNDDKLSTISIEFDELPINIASLHPWFIASTSVGLLIFAPDHETSLLQKIPVQSIHSMSTCHDLIFCGKFQQYLWGIKWGASLRWFSSLYCHMRNSTQKLKLVVATKPLKHH